MGFSSQAISVKSSINLSDINIDTDLDMGSNTIKISNNDKLEINSNPLEIPNRVFDNTNTETHIGILKTSTTDETEYTQHGTTYDTKITIPTTETGHYALAIKTDMKSSSTNPPVLGLFLDTVEIGTVSPPIGSVYNTVYLFRHFDLTGSNTLELKLKAGYPTMDGYMKNTTYEFIKITPAF